MGFLVRMRPLESLLGSLRGCLGRFPDKRRGANTTFGMADIGMAAFSVFFMQSPSFLAHQRRFEEGYGDLSEFLCARRYDLAPTGKTEESRIENAITRFFIGRSWESLTLRR